MAEYIEKRIACHRLVDKALVEQLRDECAEETTKECLDLIRSIPTADVVEVLPELRKTVELLHNEYEKAKKLDFVYDPTAYAVYQVWKAVDGRRKNGR